MQQSDGMGSSTAIWWDGVEHSNLMGLGRAQQSDGKGSSVMYFGLVSHLPCNRDQLLFIIYFKDIHPNLLIYIIKKITIHTLLRLKREDIRWVIVVLMFVFTLVIQAVWFKTTHIILLLLIPSHQIAVLDPIPSDCCIGLVVLQSPGGSFFTFAIQKYFLRSSLLSLSNVWIVIFFIM
jgi:hypothetical protein